MKYASREEGLQRRTGGLILMRWRPMRAQRSVLIGVLRDEESALAINVLVGVDMESGSKSAFSSPNRNGNDPHLIREVSKSIRQMGHHGSIAIQTDGVSSLRELMRHVACQRETPLRS